MSFRCACVYAAFAVIASAPADSLAGVYYSNSATDGAGQWTPQDFPRGTQLGGAATFEGFFLFTEQDNSMGTVFCEWALSYEDKHFRLGASGFSGHLFGAGSGDMNVALDLGPYRWHHVAFVYDGAEQRLYVNGAKVGARPATGSIRNYSRRPGDTFNEGYAGLGRYPRDNTLTNAFRGYVETFRISYTSRYSGDTFVPPSFSDLSEDGATALLFRFDEPSSSDFINGVGGNPLSLRRGRIPWRNNLVVGHPDLVSAPMYLVGDANLDGTVSFPDLLILAQNYGVTSGATWSRGDFDNNRAVEFADLLALSQNYTAGSAVGGSTDITLDWAIVQALVPEPSVGVLAGAGLIGLTRRYRRTPSSGRR